MSGRRRDTTDPGEDPSQRGGPGDEEYGGHVVEGEAADLCEERAHVGVHAKEPAHSQGGRHDGEAVAAPVRRRPRAGVGLGRVITGQGQRDRG